MKFDIYSVPNYFRDVCALLPLSTLLRVREMCGQAERTVHSVGSSLGQFVLNFNTVHASANECALAWRALRFLKQSVLPVAKVDVCLGPRHVSANVLQLSGTSDVRSLTCCGSMSGAGGAWIHKWVRRTNCSRTLRHLALLNAARMPLEGFVYICEQFPLLNRLCVIHGKCLSMEMCMRVVSTCLPQLTGLDLSFCSGISPPPRLPKQQQRRPSRLLSLGLRGFRNLNANHVKKLILPHKNLQTLDLGFCRNVDYDALLDCLAPTLQKLELGSMCRPTAKKSQIRRFKMLVV